MFYFRLSSYAERENFNYSRTQSSGEVSKNSWMQNMRQGGGDYELPKPLEETVLVRKTHHLSEPLHTIDNQKTSGKLFKLTNGAFDFCHEIQSL